jgi:hypothetical protein
VNWRSIGCGTLAAAAFVLVGLIGIWRAGAPAGCPGFLPYQSPVAYEPVGSPALEPRLDGVKAPLERAGSTSFGLAAWPVWIEPPATPLASGDPLPERMVLECGDGTFQAYRRSGR